jgi:hypothetical protein
MSIVRGKKKNVIEEIIMDISGVVNIKKKRSPPKSQIVFGWPTIPKKVLSFDIGIKNLAYCLIETTIDPSNNHRVLDWGIINIMGDIMDNAEKCVNIKRGGKKCDKPAIFYIDNESSPIYFCGDKTCSSKISMAYSKKEIKKLKQTTTKNIGLYEIGKLLMGCLNKKPNFLEVDEIVIENQPVLKNPTMKSIQMILYSYFLLRMVDRGANYKINLFNAKNKLDFYDGPEVKCEKKGEYAQRKFLSVEYTKYYIRGLPDKLEWFNSHKKKDDLADCYLQGLTYLSKNN